MIQYPQSFEAYGFTIEVHAGGRRFWPPSFKRFIKDKLDTGELSVGQVMKKCNVSKSLVYKWRADVKACRVRSVTTREERLFSEILVEEAPENGDCEGADDRIQLTRRDSAISFPRTYPVEDLARIILALEGRA